MIIALDLMFTTLNLLRHGLLLKSQFYFILFYWVESSEALWDAPPPPLSNSLVFTHKNPLSTMEPPTPRAPIS